MGIKNLFKILKLEKIEGIADKLFANKNIGIDLSCW